jgi:hypothetical protein
MKSTAVEFGTKFGMTKNDVFILNKKHSIDASKTDEEWYNILKKDFVIPLWKGVINEVKKELEKPTEPLNEVITFDKTEKKSK